MLLFSGLAFAVALFTPRQNNPLLLDWVDAGNGLFVMRHEVTIAQWQLCVDNNGCNFAPKPIPAAKHQTFPVTGIGALDAQEFVVWAQKHTGQPVQLPTLEEWYSFSEVSPIIAFKRFTDPRLEWAANYGSEGTKDPTLKRQGSFGTTSTSVADVKGNVWEWTSSCVVKTDPDRCPAYFAAGEHEATIPIFVRDPVSGGCATGTPPAHLGLRLVLKHAK